MCFDKIKLYHIVTSVPECHSGTLVTMWYSLILSKHILFQEKAIRIWTHILGNAQADHYPYGPHIGNEDFPDKNNTSSSGRLRLLCRLDCYSFVFHVSELAFLFRHRLQWRILVPLLICLLIGHFPQWAVFHCLHGFSPWDPFPYEIGKRPQYCFFLE